MKNERKASIVLPNDKLFLTVFNSFIHEFIKLCSNDERLLNRIMLSGEEAFCYAADNAFEAGDTGEITISIEFDSGAFKLVFRDKGLPFNDAAIASYSPTEPTPSIENLGLYLIQKTADAVNWEHRGTKGNQLTIYFECSYQNIADIDEQQLTERVLDKRPAQQHDYHIRLADPEDAIHISRCMYKTYGYTYVSEDIYYPEKISQQIQNGTVISAVAIDENGNVVGHCSLASRVPGILYESGQAIIDPEHRGQKLLGKLKDLLNRHATDLDIKGICSEPVTNHTRSQQTSLKTGNFSCGLMLAYAPASLTFKKIAGDENMGRVSCVYNYMPLHSVPPKTIYIPDKYAGIIEGIYSGCGIDVRVNTSEKKHLSGTTQISATHSPRQKIGFITVDDIGEECVEQIRQALFRLTMRTSANMVYLDLPIEDAQCAQVITGASLLGFVFCAVAMAADNGRDMLRLQFVNCDINFDDIQLVGETANDIMAFIKKELACQRV